MSNIVPIKFEGHSMRFMDDGWIDATTAAEKFGKLPNEFLRLPETESYIQALERRCGKIPYVKTSKARKHVAVFEAKTKPVVTNDFIHLELMSERGITSKGFNLSGIAEYSITAVE